MVVVVVLGVVVVVVVVLVGGVVMGFGHGFFFFFWVVEEVVGRVSLEVMAVAMGLGIGGVFVHGRFLRFWGVLFCLSPSPAFFIFCK